MPGLRFVDDREGVLLDASFMSLHHHYNVPRVLGFQYGYEGPVAHHGHATLELTPGLVPGLRTNDRRPRRR